ncbi:hypothetical protein D3C87_1985180 [compost metagenome]
MMRSAPRRISPNCTNPSPFTSSTDSSELSTRAHCAIQLGKASKLLPTRFCMTSNFTSTARAGALKYSSAMKNNDHPTDARAADTVGEV